MSKSDEIQKKVDTLIGSVKSFIITTYGDGINTSLGYLPFVKEGDKYYVYASEMTEHGRNLIDGADAKVMFVEDETDAKLIPARTRATFDATAKVIEEREDIIERLINEVDESYQIMYEQLEDFAMYEMTLSNGRFVHGFGAAFRQGDNGEWLHRTD